MQSSYTEPLTIWIPSNRRDKNRELTHMDGWNELKKAMESGRIVGSSRMRANVKHVSTWTRLAMSRQGWPEMDSERAIPCRVTITFVERNHRRDVGNVHGGAKYALDGLTKRHKYGAGAIYDDSQRWLPVVEYRIAYVGTCDYDEPGMRIDVHPLEKS